MIRATRSVGIATLVAALLAMGTLGVGAQEEPGPTVAQINAGSVSGSITLDGVVLEPVPGEDEDYFFSDGTGVIIIDADDDDVPLLALITIAGEIADDEIDVQSWAPAETAMADADPTVEAFMAWVAALAGGDTAAASDDTAGDRGEPTDASATPGAVVVEQLVVSGRRDVDVTGPAAVQCDGGGEVYVLADSAEVSVTGSCREIYVRGQSSAVVIDTTNELYVTGSDNDVRVADARDLDVPGDRNTISLERVREIYVEGNDNSITFAQGGRDIDDEGRGNTIARS